MTSPIEERAQALRLDPNDAVARNELGRLSLALRDHARPAALAVSRGRLEDRSRASATQA